MIPFVVKRPKSSSGFCSTTVNRARQTLTTNCSHKRRDKTFAFLKNNFELDDKSRVGNEGGKRFSSMASQQEEQGNFSRNFNRTSELGKSMDDGFMNPIF